MSNLDIYSINSIIKSIKQQINAISIKLNDVDDLLGNYKPNELDIDDILDTSKMKEFSHNKGKIGTKYEILEEGKGNKEYSCNSCGALGKWVRIKAGWRLMNKMGQIHECGKRKGKGRKYAR